MTNLNIKEVKQSVWDDFNKSQPYSLFVQSSGYSDFNIKMNEKTWTFGIYEGDILVGGAICITVTAKRGNFLYLPYGPIISNKCTDTFAALDMFFTFLKKHTQDQSLSFIRISPFISEESHLYLDIKKVGFKKAPMHILAEHTWLLPLDLTEEKLLANMKKNHRNLIRRCMREGVTITRSTDSEALDDLNKLLTITAKRHSFVKFSDDYIKHEFESLASKGEASIYKAYLPDGRLDAVAIIMQHGTMAAYRHSASLNLDKKLPTSYLLQWEVIKDAKKSGAAYYNFWGIAPKTATKKHPFYGITHFKKGFSGIGIDLIPCMDLPVSNKYYITLAIEMIRKFKRGFNNA